jgi:RHS repeat-associated protein
MTYDVRGFRRSIADPSAGRRTYDYSPLGELKSQTNARGEVTTFGYDRLSRPLTRSEPEGTTTWTWGTSAASRNIGALAAVSSPGFQESYQYDSRGRLAATSTTISGATLVTGKSYDATTGLLDVLTYPASGGATPLRVRHHYERGRLVRLSDADTGGNYWQLNAVDSFGQVTDETLGNGVRVASAYDAVTARLDSRSAGPGGGSAFQNLGFAWDAIGSLTLREERNRGVQEQFFYDVRDRLDYVTRGGSVVLDLAYDDAGNLTYKSDVGDYRYDGSRRQAVLAAGANTYAYDANGAVVNASGTTISWLSYDLPSQLTHPAGNYSAFYYAPDRERYRQVASAGGVLTETLYAAAGLYERVASGGVTSSRNYIVADGRRVAVQSRQAGSAPSTVYLLEDHLGGVDGLTSAAGELLTRNSYQPFGARRSGDWVTSTPTAGEWQRIQATTARGFTDHEHLDNLGIVHMNGRVYDPVLGRFLSPDPMVQAPYDTQGLNRYAYARNNPLRYTDPTGFCFNGHPAADHQAQQCMEQILVQASRSMASFGWLADLAQWQDLSSLVAEAGTSGAAAVDSNNEAIEEVVATAQRLSPQDVLNFTVRTTDFLARTIVFDYVDPLGGSYWLEAATLLPIGKVAKAGRVRHLASGQTRRVFWSGGRAAEDAAREFARANGGVVIGDTFAGRALARSAQNVAWSDVRPLWVDLSREFARGAQGSIDVFQNARGLSLDSIWRSEHVELLRNPAVTSINYHVVMPDGSVVPVP